MMRNHFQCRIIRTKRVLVAYIFVAIALFLGTFPEGARAQVVINEVSPASSPEWVEIYNTSSIDIVLKNYLINFGSDSQIVYFCDNDKILGNGYKLIYLNSSWLANTGDIVILKNGDDEADSVGYGTGYSLSKPSATSSITRSPDGGSNWILTGEISPQGEIASFDCPTLAPTFSPNPTDVASYKATYKINPSKDGTGNELTNVQIYVDGTYIHHENDETLYFYNGHECYSGVNCNLGMHTISLRKSGYNSWENTQEFTAGLNLEVNPILSIIQTSSPSPTSTLLPTPKPTIYKTSTPSAEPISGELEILQTPGVLGINAGPSLETVNENTQSVWKRFTLPILIITIGIGFIGFSIFSIIRNEKKENIKIS
jgi:hypothetical protein